MNLARHFRNSAFFCVIVTIFIISGCNNGISSTASSSSQGQIKYVFYFIGDGMGSVQIRATEAYLASLEEGYRENNVEMKKVENLTFSNLPAFGMVITYCANRFITDSAAAGTALATGEKTLAEVVSLRTDKQTRLNTIAEKAKAKGMKVGIVTSVGIDHATPAVFYAHEVNRNNYYNIGVQLANSDFDYFAGGSLHQPNPPRRPAGRRGGTADANTADVNAPAVKNTYEVAKDNGFKVVTSREELNNCKPGERVIAYNKAEESRNELYSAIDKPDNCMSLAEFTVKGIELLDNDKGFFMMVESGQIDNAGHDNDAATAIHETLAFNEAIDKAMDFYKEHPDETLIVVTADHETGGMTLGSNASQYNTNFALLKNQKMSQGLFAQAVLSKYNSEQWNGIQDNIPDGLKNDIAETFGIGFNNFDSYEKSLLEDAYDKRMASAKRIRISEDELPNQNKISSLEMTLTRIYNNKAGIGWSTTAHTGVSVEVHAIGSGCEIFNGFYDNTDVPKKMAKLIGIELNN